MLQNPGSRNGKVLMGLPDRLAQDVCHRYFAQLFKLLFLWNGNRVGHNNLFKHTRFAEPFNGRPRQNGVGGHGVNGFGSLFAQQLCACHNGARGVNHIIDENGDFAVDITDEVHDFRDVVCRSSLIDDGERCIIQHLCKVSCSCNSTHIRRHNDHIIQMLSLLSLEVLDKGHGAMNMVYGNIIKPTRLRRMDIHDDDSIGTCLDK
mmetsp:Transcript_16522/g.28915  ORF Transcript_16522/g.28915 Transcript_16522/m.28915 type:complete len:205 (-) Transcript_16522:417-1031(-)